MINSSGVIFSYTPSQPQKKSPAGPSESRSTQPIIQPAVPIQKQNQQQPVSIPKKSGFQHIQPIKQTQRQPQPFNQPGKFPPKPMKQAPFPPLPGYNSAFPQYPTPSTRPNVPRNNPFAYPGMQKPPSRFAQATTLEEFVPPTQKQQNQQFHNGLPIEEIPEIHSEQPETIHTIDTTFVDKLFGMKPQPLPQSEVKTQAVLHIEEQIMHHNKPNVDTETVKNIPIKNTVESQPTPIEPQIQVPLEQKQQPHSAPIEQQSKIQSPSPMAEQEGKQTEQISQTTPSLETTKNETALPTPVVTPTEEKPTPQTESSKSEQPLVQTTEHTKPSAKAPSPYIPEGLSLPQTQKQVEKKKKRFQIPFLQRNKAETPPVVQPIQQPQPAVPTAQKAKSESVETEKPSSTDVLKPNFSVKKTAGVALVVLALLGLTVPFIPKVMLERTYAQLKRSEEEKRAYDEARPLPDSVPFGFNPMMAPDGSIVEPVNTNFSIVIPSVGINATVLPGIDPLNTKSYLPALKQGVAHSKTSYFPNQQGSVYLFSHSTNYEWFVNDLNAVFYNVKNLEPGQYIILFYEGKRYVYEYKESKVVSPKDTAELIPDSGKRELILQTCWPPGSISQRLLLYADLIEVK